MHLSIHPSIHSFIHSSIRPSFCLLVGRSVSLTIYLSIYPSIYPFIYLFLHVHVCILSLSIYIYIQCSYICTLYSDPWKRGYNCTCAWMHDHRAWHFIGSKSFRSYSLYTMSTGHAKHTSETMGMYTYVPRIRDTTGIWLGQISSGILGESNAGLCFYASSTRDIEAPPPKKNNGWLTLW